jgi:hypothetical protein
MVQAHIFNRTATIAAQAPFRQFEWNKSAEQDCVERERQADADSEVIARGIPI